MHGRAKLVKGNDDDDDDVQYEIVELGHYFIYGRFVYN
jgi:hypothetical protein